MIFCGKQPMWNLFRMSMSVSGGSIETLKIHAGKLKILTDTQQGHWVGINGISCSQFQLYIFMLLLIDLLCMIHSSKWSFFIWLRDAVQPLRSSSDTSSFTFSHFKINLKYTINRWVECLCLFVTSSRSRNRKSRECSGLTVTGNSGHV